MSSNVFQPAYGRDKPPESVLSRNLVTVITAADNEVSTKGQLASMVPKIASIAITEILADTDSAKRCTASKEARLSC